MMKRLIRLAIATCAAALAMGSAALAADGADIVWDRYDVPHIYAQSDDAAFRAFGWAQMQLRAPSILRLYGLARGRGAEYWGERDLRRDLMTRRLGIPARSETWWAALPAADKSRIDAFVRGMNAYAEAHPEAIPAELRQVLPLTSLDVMSHTQRVIFLTYLAPWEAGYARDAEAAAKKLAGEGKGSNAYAIAPSRSASGSAMLVIAPHLSWRDEFLFVEAQLNLTSGPVYGVAGVGSPFLSIAFSEKGGWTHTVNPFDGSDTYQLKLADGGYLLDGKVLPFTTRTETVKVRKADGSVESRDEVIRTSVHGPVILEGEGGRAYALRLAALDSQGVFRQYWDMGAAPGLKAFESASSRLRMPFFNTIYAGQDGHIYYLYGGRAPLRASGDWDFWQKIVPGDRADLIWDQDKSLPYSAMPHFSDPASGFVQNTNEPPWSSTYPNVLKPEAYPAYMAPPPAMDMRAQRSVRRVLEDSSITFDELVALKQDDGLELADRVLDDLIRAASASTDPLVQRAVAVLKAWDRKALADSRGAVLFVDWAYASLEGGEAGVFAEAWDPKRPVATPRGLADPAKSVAMLKTVAAQVETRWSRLDVAWGEANRLQRDGVDLPASGAPFDLGGYRVMWTQPTETGPQPVMGGDTFVAVVEFGKRVKATGILAYGNSDTKGAASNREQLELFSKSALRPIWFYRDDVERNAARREQLH